MAIPTRRSPVVFAPPPCQRLPTQTSTLPFGISAAMESYACSGLGEWSARCVPGHRRVAPLASVKSVMAHIVLQMIGGWGLGIGTNWSSEWMGCADSSGPMAIEDSEEMRSPGSRTRSTIGSTFGWIGIRW